MPAERRARLQALLRQSAGWPTNLSATEREELRTLVGEMNIGEVLGDTALRVPARREIRRRRGANPGVAVNQLLTVTASLTRAAHSHRKEPMTRTQPFSPRVRRAAMILLLVGTLFLAGCGTKVVSSTGSNGQVTTQTVPNVHFAKTKFLLHAGLAFGAFHRYIYKPLRNGALRSGAPGRIRVLLKGAAAAAFIVHELRLAHDDALASDLLRPLVNKVDGLGSKIGALASGLKNGSFSPADIVSSASATNALGAASSGLGAGIKDISSAAGG